MKEAKSMDWFLYDNGLRDEKVKLPNSSENTGGNFRVVSKSFVNSLPSNVFNIYRPFH